MRRARPKEKVLRAVRPNAGLTALYRQKIMALVDEMSRSYMHWLRAAYRADPPEMAQDARSVESYRSARRNELFERGGRLSSAQLQKRLRELGIHWQGRFDEAAPRLARYFAIKVTRRSDDQLKRILRDAGMSVEFKMTPEIRDIAQATVSENVSLIRSIASEYHTQVEGLVMRSVTAGRDLSTLTTELQERYGVTERRAKLIALSQNNQATGAIQRARQVQVGITEAVWLHSHAGKTPRKTHLANNGNRYNIAEGWFDPDPKVRKLIRPGELINCRCVSKPIVKGFT